MPWVTYIVTMTVINYIMIMTGVIYFMTMTLILVGLRNQSVGFVFKRVRVGSV